ncbi:MAG: DUF2937 family protein [Chlamydiales bacterium]|nr:DUF2937 family protein [Chlamydiales bacterium]
MCDRLFSLVGALLFMQIPQFMQQYTYLLQGHVSELHIQVKQIEQVAKVSHKSLGEYIQKFVSSNDIDFSSQGVLLQKLVERMQEMTSSLKSLQEASIWAKPFIFFKQIDLGIFNETLAAFRLGVYLSLESLVYMLVGLCFGYFFYTGLSRIFRKNKHKENV